MKRMLVAEPTAEMLKNAEKAKMLKIIFLCKYSLGLNPNRYSNFRLAKEIIEL